MALFRSTLLAEINFSSSLMPLFTSPCTSFREKGSNEIVSLLSSVCESAATPKGECIFSDAGKSFGQRNVKGGGGRGELDEDVV